MDGVNQTATPVVDERNRAFLEHALPWPEPNAPRYIDLHVKLKNEDPQKNDGKPWVVGWPYTNLDDLSSRAFWIDSTETLFNTWTCMSRQSEKTLNRKGAPKAVR